MELQDQGTSILDYDEQILETIVRGVEIYYYKVCLTKLWFFMKDLGMEYSSDIVVLGRILHNRHFREKAKNVLINEKISIDFLTRGNTVYIHEIKHSDVMEDGDKLQVQYYIYNLLLKGVPRVFGIIHYPKKNKRVKVVLDKEGYKEIVKGIEMVERLKNQSSPPAPIKKKICRKCSYFEFCWVE